MKQEISALMDGEVFEDEADGLLDRIKRDSGANSDWELYHLIGDALRQPDHVHCDLSIRVRERMQDEPTILAPRVRASKQKARAFALSAAASVVALSVVAWMSQRVGPEAPPKMAMQQTALRPASAQIQVKANDYLMAHQEFSPSADMGGASFIRTVSYNPEGR